jgi:hypothetical protein
VSSCRHFFLAIHVSHEKKTLRRNSSTTCHDHLNWAFAIQKHQKLLRLLRCPPPDRN